eukprot:5090229-Pyramimonas_sp.AAC.1
MARSSVSFDCAEGVLERRRWQPECQLGGLRVCEQRPLGGRLAVQCWWARANGGDVGATGGVASRRERLGHEERA